MGNGFGAPVTLSAAGENANSPRVALDQAGETFAVWERFDGANNIVRALLPSPPPSNLPPPPPPPIGCNPCGSGGGTPRPGGQPPLLRVLPGHGVPSLSALHVWPATFVTAGRLVVGRCVRVTPGDRGRRRCTRPFVLRVTFTIAAASRVTFRIERAAAGRRVATRCVAAPRHIGQARRCTRLLALRGSISRQARAGTDTFVLAGRFGAPPLAPGSYRLIATPSASGKAGQPVAASFRVAP